MIDFQVGTQLPFIRKLSIPENDYSKSFDQRRVGYIGEDGSKPG